MTVILPRLKELCKASSSDKAPSEGEEVLKKYDMIARPFYDGISIFYLEEAGEQYSYIEKPRLRELRLDADALHRHALRDLEHFMAPRLRVETITKDVSMFVGCEGFESSLVLLPHVLRANGFIDSIHAFAMPTRDTFVYGSKFSSETIDVIRRAISVAYTSTMPSHRVSRSVFVFDRNRKSGLRVVGGLPDFVATHAATFFGRP
jgi:hypothetical protein